MSPRDGPPCEHAFTLHANVEMVSDSITDAEVKDAISKGARTRNVRGPGFLYALGAVTVVAESEPCHHFIITAYKGDARRPSIKDKPYRRRLRSRRG